MPKESIEYFGRRFGHLDRFADLSKMINYFITTVFTGQFCPVKYFFKITPLFFTIQRPQRVWNSLRPLHKICFLPLVL